MSAPSRRASVEVTGGCS